MTRQPCRNTENFQIFYTNSNGISNKLSELSVISQNSSIGAICPTESHLTNQICDAEISLPNFDVFREDRATNEKGGGSVIFVRKQFKAQKLNWFHGTESLALKVHLTNSELYIVCMYRSPSHRTIEANTKLLSQNCQE